MWKGLQHESRINLAGFVGRVWWSGDEHGHKGSFAGFRLVGTFPDAAKAKAAVERVATQKAEELLAAVCSLK